MGKKSLSVIVVFLLFVLSLFVVPIQLNVCAETIPNNSPEYNSGSIGDDAKPNRPSASDVFGDATIQPDSTGFSDDIGNVLSMITSFIIKTCNYVFIFGLLIHFAVESVMMAFPIVATTMATRIPIQLFSNECAKVCGVKYSYKPGGQGGDGAAQQSSGGDGKDKGFVGKFTEYFKERMITLILCGVILVMCATGIMPWLINTAINWIIGLLF